MPVVPHSDRDEPGEPAQVTTPGRQVTNKKLILTLAGAVGVAALASSAFTASNTVAPNKAGQGAGDVTGYAATTVHYTLNSTDPQKIDHVAFTLDTAPKAGSTIKVQLDSATTTWYTCSNIVASVPSTSVTCATTSPVVTTTAANTLNVVVTD
jgi:hypothetical protein